MPRLEVQKKHPILNMAPSFFRDKKAKHNGKEYPYTYVWEETDKRTELVDYLRTLGAEIIKSTIHEHGHDSDIYLLINYKDPIFQAKCLEAMTGMFSPELQKKIKITPKIEL